MSRVRMLEVYGIDVSTKELRERHTNEILDVALRVFGQGGNENEIFPAWKTSRVSKDIEGAPFLPGSLIWKMVERLYRSDPDWLLGEWAAAGRRLGERPHRPAWRRAAPR